MASTCNTRREAAASSVSVRRRGPSGQRHHPVKCREAKDKTLHSFVEAPEKVLGWEVLCPGPETRIRFLCSVTPEEKSPSMKTRDEEEARPRRMHTHVYGLRSGSVGWRLSVSRLLLPVFVVSLRS